ncbi:hypothetical protein PIB30_054471 [Stylosanthes scabra]|uniref:Uncharacterized protein n=1 Tax=Stylosanthes scabra TaxID=79078 RepID=A0ABU6WK07_9FABA|nr:hypothetical protein [Stylosanthes scabra]
MLDGVFMGLVYPSLGCYGDSSSKLCLAVSLKRAFGVYSLAITRDLQEDLFSLFSRHEADCSFLPSSCCIPGFVSFFGIRGECSPRTFAIPAYASATYGPAPVPGPVYPVPRTPMCDARRYCSFFSRHRVTPPTPPPPSPSPSDDEPSAETYDPAADLEGDPDEPYVAERVPYGAPEAYYFDATYRSERESASAGSAPSSHHSFGSSSGSVSLGYGSTSSGSASDGASDDDLVNRYFAGTFPPP